MTVNVRVNMTAVVAVVAWTLLGAYHGEPAFARASPTFVTRCRERRRAGASTGPGAGGPGGPQAPQFVSPEILPDRRVAFRIYAPQARAIRLSAVGHSRRWSGHAAVEGRPGRVGSHARSPRRRRLSLQLQRRRRGDDRSAQPRDQRIEQQRVEPRVRAGLGPLRYQRRPARRGRRGDLQLHRARQVPPDARLHAARLRDRAAAAIRSSTCCTAPETTTMPGRRWGGPASFSTTSSPRKKRARWSSSCPRVTRREVPAARSAGRRPTSS